MPQHNTAPGSARPTRVARRATANSLASTMHLHVTTSCLELSQAAVFLPQAHAANTVRAGSADTIKKLGKALACSRLARSRKRTAKCGGEIPPGTCERHESASRRLQLVHAPAHRKRLPNLPHPDVGSQLELHSHWPALCSG